MRKLCLRCYYTYKVIITARSRVYPVWHMNSPYYFSCHYFYYYYYYDFSHIFAYLLFKCVQCARNFQTRKLGVTIKLKQMLHTWQSVEKISTWSPLIFSKKVLVVFRLLTFPRCLLTLVALNLKTHCIEGKTTRKSLLSSQSLLSLISPPGSPGFQIARSRAAVRSPSPVDVTAMNSYKGLK